MCEPADTGQLAKGGGWKVQRAMLGCYKDGRRRKVGCETFT